MMTDTYNIAAALEQARESLKNLENPKKAYPLMEIINTAKAIFGTIESAGLSLKNLDPKGTSTDQEVRARIQRAAIGAYFLNINQMISALESETEDISTSVRNIREGLKKKFQDINRAFPNEEDVLGPRINGPLTNMQQAIEARIRNATITACILQINLRLDALKKYKGSDIELCESRIREIDTLFKLIENGLFVPDEQNRQTVKELNAEFAQVRFDLYFRIITANIEELKDPNKLFTVDYMENVLPWMIRRLAAEANQVISQLPETAQNDATVRIQTLQQSLNPTIIDTCLKTADKMLSTLEVRDLTGKSNTKLLTWSAIKDKVTMINGYAELAQKLNNDSTDCHAGIQGIKDRNDDSTNCHAAIQRIKDRIDSATVTASLTNLQAGVLAIKFKDKSHSINDATACVCVLDATSTIHEAFYKAANDPRKVDAKTIAEALSKATNFPYDKLPFYYQERLYELERLAKMAAAAQARIAAPASAPSPGGGS